MQAGSLENITGIGRNWFQQACWTNNTEEEMMHPTAHKLKCWPEYFKNLWNGSKTFEVRKNDRDFMVNDILILAEWNPDKELFTGKTVVKVITYILDGGNFGIEPGHVVMSLGDFDIDKYKIRQLDDTARKV